MAGIKQEFKRITDALSDIEEVRVVILYGGFARGEITSRSDIDLFIIVSRDVKDDIEARIIELEKKMERRIQPIIRTEKQLISTDSGLLQNIFQEGKILFLREYFDFPVTFLLEHKPFVIYKFDISNLKQSKKAQFNRELYGYRDKKYVYKGTLQEVGGSRLSSGCILIPFGSVNIIEAFFKRKRVGYETTKVWK